MKPIGIVATLVLVCGSAIGTAHAQFIQGTGTPNTIPKFVYPWVIGDSPILVSPSGNIGIGTSEPHGLLSVINTSQVQSFGEGPFGVYARVETPINASAAVRGDATATSGGSAGVIGLTWGILAGVAGYTLNPDGDGYGVIGSHPGGIGVGGGVAGFTASTSGGFGVSATAEATAGGAIALYAESRSSESVAAYLVNKASGNILVGVAGNDGTPVFRVDGRGRVHANGGFRPFGADFAESVPVKGDPDRYEPGDLMVIDHTGNRRLALADHTYSTLVAGIYSTRPGVLASPYPMDDSSLTKEVPMAVVGIVPCKVTAQNGPIHPGDLLVSSSTPGRAMKGTDRERMLGAVVGKALEPLRQGTGIIQVLITLQ